MFLIGPVQVVLALLATCSVALNLTSLIHTIVKPAGFHKLLLANKCVRANQNTMHSTWSNIRHSQEVVPARLTAWSGPASQDAFDAVGYFHLALAAALEDRGNPRALYTVYVKLAEIHAHHMPDATLSSSYMDHARALRDALEQGAGKGTATTPPGTQTGGTGLSEETEGTGTQSSNLPEPQHKRDLSVPVDTFSDL